MLSGAYLFVNGKAHLFVSLGGGRGKEIVWAGAVLVCLLVLCYANSFNAAWQYDDFGNIVDNSDVHMTELSWAQIVRVLDAGLDYQIVSRPMAFLSFALNYRFGQTHVFGYHLVNFIIHWLSALFLFLWVRDTLQLPVFGGRYANSEALIACLAAGLWAVHPIQVSAVTYIVQRMASMAGLFFVVSMYLYQLGRRARRRKRRIVAYGLCLISALCALLTKENTVLLAPTILLYDVVLIQGATRQSIRRGLLLAAGALGVIAVVGLLYTDPRTLLEPYANRPFSMIERLLTQPRVLFMYVSLLAVPMTTRMTIIHDVAISHSMFDPWSTSAAIGGWAVVVILMVLWCRRYPLVSFCILFFLLNHLIESSIFNLELAYEHRNYIPSMTIFMPVAVAACRTAVYFHYSRILRSAVWLTVACTLVSFGYTTFAYNRIFGSELSLWHHAVLRAPRLSLSHNNLGNIYWNMGLRELAYREFKRAYELNRYFNLPHKALVYHNLGLYTAYQDHDYRRALNYFLLAKKWMPGNPQIWYQTARMRTAMEDYATASAELTEAMAYWPKDADLHYLSGLVAVRQGHCTEAIAAARQALSYDPDHLDALPVLAQGYRCMGRLGLSVEKWKVFLAREPKNLFGILALIELYDLEGDSVGLRRAIKQFVHLGGSDASNQLMNLAVRQSELSPYVPDPIRIRNAVKSWNAAGS
jgi:tetratricopeptide (TPR) repeat protein